MLPFAPGRRIHSPREEARTRMKRFLCACTVLLTAVAIQSVPSGAQTQGPAKPLRVIAFGAHPDDAELKASGVAALWAAQGHKVKFVAMTNGDVGHFAEAGGAPPPGRGGGEGGGGQKHGA